MHNTCESDKTAWCVVFDTCSYITLALWEDDDLKKH